MILIDINKLNNSHFAIENISAVEMIPKRAAFSYGRYGRSVSGFLYILEGSCEFILQGKKTEAAEESLVYIPEGSMHSYRKTSEQIKYIRVDFNVIDLENIKTAVFSDSPTLIFRKTPACCSDIIRKLAKCYISKPKSFYLTGKSYIFRLLAEIVNLHQEENAINSDISAAISYIEKNYTKSFPKTVLSDMCRMSPSHFRSVFKKTVGCSPGEYQQQIRLEKAQELLRADILSVSEIAEKLGFESVYYFSRFFKKLTGYSPLNWKKALNFMLPDKIQMKSGTD